MTACCATYIYLPDGTFVNAELVRRGYAQVATFPPDVRHVDLFTQLQGEARAAGLSLWAGVANAPAPTDAPQPTAVPVATDTPDGEPPAPSSPQVIIGNILFDGAKGRNEPDEYIDGYDTDDNSGQLWANPLQTEVKWFVAPLAKN